MGHKELPFYCSGFVIHSESVGGTEQISDLKRGQRTQQKGFFVLFCSAQNMGLFEEKASLWLHKKELVSHCKRPRFVQTADEEDSWQSLQSLSRHGERRCREWAQ